MFSVSAVAAYEVDSMYSSMLLVEHVYFRFGNLTYELCTIQKKGIIIKII